MKSLLLTLSLVISTTAFADGQTNCQRNIYRAVKASAKAAGVKTNFGFEVSEPSDAGKDVQGLPLNSYSTSAFFIDDGYISNSGAVVTVREKTCEIIKLELDLGQ
jgi:hypothetical protein